MAATARIQRYGRHGFGQFTVGDVARTVCGTCGNVVVMRNIWLVKQLAAALGVLCSKVGVCEMVLLLLMRLCFRFTSDSGGGADVATNIVRARCRAPWQ